MTQTNKPHEFDRVIAALADWLEESRPIDDALSTDDEKSLRLKKLRDIVTPDYEGKCTESVMFQTWHDILKTVSDKLRAENATLKSSQKELILKAVEMAREMEPPINLDGIRVTAEKHTPDQIVKELTEK